MDTLLYRRAMMLAGPKKGDGNYLIYGSPTISGTTYIPNTTTKGFIYTDVPFDPGTSEWIIQTKIKMNTASAWKDIIASVDIRGGRQYSIVAQTNTNNSNTGFGLYLSSNGTSWDVTSNSPKGQMGLGTWRIFQIVCTRSGDNYIYKMGYPENSSWTTTLSTTEHPIFGKHISFGGGFAGTSTDCEIDLSETKILVDGQVWWHALNPVFYNYIYFDGTAYIDTTVTIPSDGSVRVGLGMETSQTQQQVFIAEGTNGGYIGMFIGGGTNTTKRQVVPLYDSTSYIASNRYLYWSYTSYGFFMTPSRFGWGNSQYTYTKGSLHPDGGICLGRSTNTSTSRFTGRMSTTQIYGSDASGVTTDAGFNSYTPAAMLRPCTYGGVPGLWYVEGRTFFGNSAGSGTLTVSDS